MSKPSIYVVVNFVIGENAPSGDFEGVRAKDVVTQIAKGRNVNVLSYKNIGGNLRKMVLIVFSLCIKGNTYTDPIPERNALVDELEVELFKLKQGKVIERFKVEKTDSYSTCYVG
ncbi:MAG: hypothetical protein UU77_C0029G0019 [candidate division WWE3 bacterium GW2011_GWC1_41_7]|uniref:Uncharacterized protein n=3 Tax=Katanobacteria TaxID=422282 RepID=A0A0G0XC74_UNCKA|nr:MAG: hypothetical protein UU77_C0029G0019 [candidate division WWE3 bacterium GW2011_GWC1_41_7]KKS21987.1 MAG: hypothetical protein UU80_C0016G0019 [candidate division WWE3 bacterium GW2011_GWA1_41_8]OGC56799.1 MAG: hypothetical protein A2976_01550 [candidate division WWE3 bacterium RIFCSPLOWO2_01_FULL_41_9]